MLSRSPSFYIILLLLLLPFYAFGQNNNIVVNPSFEKYSLCPNNFSQIGYATGWYQPTGGTCDFFNACGAYRMLNTFGYQKPHTGVGLAGFYAFYNSSVQYREYVGGTLSSPLVKGQEYHVSFYINLSGLSSLPSPGDTYYISDMGLFFSDSLPFNSTIGPYVHAPDIANASSNFLKDTANWTQISGDYIARGGEKYFMIGNFEDNAHTHARNICNCTGIYAYYFLDDVFVGNYFRGYKDTMHYCPGGLRISGHSGDTVGRWNNGTIADSITINGPGMYIKSYYAGADSVRDTIVVLPSPVNYHGLGIMPKQCAGTAYKIRLPQDGSRYVWDDKDTGSVHDIASAGVHYFSGTRLGCTFGDTLVITYDSAITFPLPSDTTVCAGTTVHLNISAVRYDVRWQNGSISKLMELSSPGTYTVSATNACGTFAHTIRVHWDTAVTLSLPDTLQLCVGKRIELHVGQVNGNISWQNGSSDKDYIITQPGIYTLKAWNTCGAVSRSVEINPINCDCQVWIPGAFTPDGNTLNDTLKASSACTVEHFSMQVYNRWGECVYVTNDMRKGWDGTFHGAPCQEGVYLYRLTFKPQGQDFIYQSGSVALLR